LQFGRLAGVTCSGLISVGERIGGRGSRKERRTRVNAIAKRAMAVANIIIVREGLKSPNSLLSLATTTWLEREGMIEIAFRNQVVEAKITQEIEPKPTAAVRKRD